MISKYAIVGMNVFDSAMEERSKCFKIFFSKCHFFPSFGFLVKVVYILANFVNPNGAIGIALFRRFAICEWDDSWCAKF